MTLICFEGIDGCGKDTQIELTADWLRTVTNRPVVVTRQPGGTEIGQTLRRLLLDPASQINIFAEFLIFAADQAQHTDWIKEQLSNGAIVLTNRYAYSSLAYQMYGRGLETNFKDHFYSIIKFAQQGLWPAQTIWLDVPVETGLARVHQNGNLDRLEQKGAEFFERVRAGYIELAEIFEFKRIDGTQSIDTVQSQIRGLFLELNNKLLITN